MADVAVPAFKKRTTKVSNIRKRPATPPPEGSDSGSDSDYTDDEAGLRIKRRKKDGVTVSSDVVKRAPDLSKSTTFDADRSANITTNDDATKTSNWYTEAANAAEAVRATVRARNEANQDQDGAYKGSASYSNFIQKNPDAPNRQVGPVKASTNVRMITLTDFAPDVCKDYKQTGFCGFGDNCKFLHAREDYKQGWQLDKEWESAGKSKKLGTNTTNNDANEDDMDEEEKMLEKIPFACIICKEPYKNPVVTKCGHYFCEKCAMGRYMKEKKRMCAACGLDTNGTFHVAKKLKELLEKKRRRMEERRAAEEGNGAGDEGGD